MIDPAAPAPIGHNRPPAPKKTYTRICPETGATFVADHHTRLFSTDAAKVDFHNRSSKIGRSLVPLAMAWRAGRNVKGSSPEAKAKRASAAKAFSAMCAILDEAVSDDRVSGRMAKVDYLRRRDAIAGTLAREETVAWQEAEEKRVERLKATAEKSLADARDALK